MTVSTVDPAGRLRYRLKLRVLLVVLVALGGRIDRNEVAHDDEAASAVLDGLVVKAMQ